MTPLAMLSAATLLTFNLGTLLALRSVYNAGKTGR
jgi:hypothetical protein